MSKIYYNFYPTCPNRSCHEPHKTGKFLEINDETICCKTCGSIFSKFLNLEQTIGIKSYLLRCGAEEEQLKRTRLFWKMIPNSLEKAYMDWVCKKPKGQFLITWPWSDVRFLPALAVEYTQTDLKNRIAIICNMEKNNIFLSSPSADIAFNHLVYISEHDIIQNEEIKKWLFKYIDKELIKKSKNINVIVKSRSSSEEKVIQCHESSLLKCKNRIIRDLQDESGSAIYRIITRANGTLKEEILNEDGTFEIILYERMEWSGDLSYNKYWELQVLSSIKSIHKPSCEIAHNIIKSADDVTDAMSTAKIIFISENMPAEQLFSVIEDTDVNMVVVEDVDNFIKDIIYSDGWRSKNLIKFLKNNSNKFPVLMFSSKPHIRHLHKLFLKTMDKEHLIALHTWDTQKRMDILFNARWLESSYPNPCFSLKEQVLNHGKIPVIECEQLEDLDALFSDIDLLLEKMPYQDSNSKEIIETFFRDLRKTPLKYVGDYTKKDVFSRKFLDIYWTFDSILNIIINLDQNIYKKIMEIQDCFFKNCRNNPSYIFSRLIKLAKEEIDKGSHDLDITIVIHPFDVKGCERLFQDSELAELFNTGRISVSTWSMELKSRCRKESCSGKRHIIFSTESPYFDFNIYKNNIEKIVFIGCKKNLKKTKELLEKRISEIHTRPIAALSENADAPPLLREIESFSKDIEIINVKDPIYSVMINPYDVSNSSSNKSEWENDTSEALPTRERYLKAGEEVLLAIGKDGRGVLFPINATIHYREHCDESGIKESRIERDYNLFRHLRDVEIFMGKGDIHRSLKVQFAKIMIETAGELPVESGLFRWNSVSELFYDSVEWIRYLLEAREYLAEKKHGYRNVDDELADRIVKSGTCAEDSNYVKRWWEEYEGELCIDSEILRIPFVEHPRNIDDIKKIYKLINKIIPSAQLTEDMAIRSYNSANVIQKLRRSVLSGNSMHLPIYLIKAYTLLRPLILEIWERSDKFYAEYFDIITLKRDALGFKIISISDL